ncbi:deoxyribose-phosphate aldolase [Paraconexibacter antarcticus]|uniref:Deoxyribose-phosphate aldolase n=1 Tax=Paraconexibacter antarcticus TaxID=2949664 RepID=A0ABY5DUW5_9ACTN|nr:deoxyribose-phosphate aldolase [Paraconexibacter antarcticus]UTI65808.1 deoxyribose-phosphate aldolase [Paraconexibacter antarcticus]
MPDPISLLDLTSLNDDDTAAVVDALCVKAITPAGPVAAVCVMPRFVSVAAEALDGTGVRVATVANFPAGEDDADGAARDTASLVDEGADEVDVVAPWRAHLAGDHEAVERLVAACAAECPGHLKVILETGSHGDAAATRAMADAALRGGAAFLKTSTGKVGPGTDLASARILLEAVAAHDRPAGVKISGGVRTRADAEAYLALAEEVMGIAWASPFTFRFGASTLLDDLLATRAPAAGG